MLINPIFQLTFLFAFLNVCVNSCKSTRRNNCLSEYRGFFLLEKISLARVQVKCRSPDIWFILALNQVTADVSQRQCIIEDMFCTSFNTNYTLGQTTQICFSVLPTRFFFLLPIPLPLCPNGQLRFCSLHLCRS